MVGMSRIAVSAAMGVLAACVMAGAYIGAPYAGMRISPSLLMVAAAAVKSTANNKQN